MLKRTVKLWLAIFLIVGASRATFAADIFPIFSDFDGDNKVDQAELFSSGAEKSIHVSLGKLAWKSLSFNSGVQDRGQLVSGDIDRDGDIDLVWISQNLPQTQVTWLGDGKGNFSIAQGNEREQFQTLLLPATPTRVHGSANDDELDGIPQTVPAVALQRVGFVGSNFVSERSSIEDLPRAIGPPCVSILRKRGPPPQQF